MWKYLRTFYYILTVIRFISCCQCNLNHTDLNKEKRQLEGEEFTATEIYDNTAGTDTNETTSDFPTTNQYQTIFLDAHETTTEFHESILRILEVEANKSHMPEENNTVIIDNIFDINENSSEEMDASANETAIKYEPEILNDTEITTERLELNERKETERVSKRKETKKLSVWEEDTLNERGETEQPSNDDLVKKCRHYKNGNSFKMDKMTDVWQVVYYRLPHKMKCFKININLVTHKEQQRYARIYGTFNDTVNWERCFLEITSAETEKSERRHFLQGAESDRGTMVNVIIDEEYRENTTYLTLHGEGGDQWLVINNLLLMRDCDNGDYVVFTRYPKQPRRTDIMVALAKFGENNPNGTVACNLESSWLTHVGENLSKL